MHAQTRPQAPVSAPAKARMSNPALVHDDAMQALQALHKATQDKGIPENLLELVSLRASQINGCGPCLLGHALLARKMGETEDRLSTLQVWRESPYFTDAERAALALTEAVTLIADGPEPVTDEVWAEAARHYNEKALAALVLAIANINVWNRLNIAVKQPIGVWRG